MQLSKIHQRSQAVLSSRKATMLPFQRTASSQRLNDGPSEPNFGLQRGRTAEKKLEVSSTSVLLGSQLTPIFKIGEADLKVTRALLGYQDHGFGCPNPKIPCNIPNHRRNPYDRIGPLPFEQGASSATSEPWLHEISTSGLPNVAEVVNAYNLVAESKGLKAVNAASSKKPLHRASFNIPQYGSRTRMKCDSLDEILRIGGTNSLRLPCKFAAASLEVPTGLAATASYLIQHGIGVDRLFCAREPTGNADAIYNFYVSQIDAHRSDACIIQKTVALPALPAHIAFTTHDVASAFKMFLSDLPTGILGSAATFDSLKEIIMIEGSSDKPKLIALVILTCSSSRFAVISAVFGLLAYLNQSSAAAEFGIAFGPILLGASVSQARLIFSSSTSQSSPHDTALVSRVAQKLRLKFKARKRSYEITDAGLSDSGAQISANIARFLVEHWEDVVKEMKVIRLAGEGEISNIMSAASARDVPGAGLESLLEDPVDSV